VNINAAPVLRLENLPVIVFCPGEDSRSFDIAPFITSDDAITLTSVSDNADITVSIDGTIVTVSSTAADAATAILTVTATDESGQSVSGSVNVKVNALPAAGFTDNGGDVCSTTVTMRSTEAAAAAARIFWTVDGNEFEGKNFVYNFGAAGTYSVTQTVVSSAGCTNSVTQDVTVGEPFNPTVTITKVDNADESATLSIEGSFASVTWYAGGSVIEGATGNSVTVTANGTYYVVVGNDRGCEKRSANVTVTNVAGGPVVDPNPKPVGLPEDISSLVSVYPNPAVSNAAVRIDSDVEGVVSIQVSDVTGRLLMSQEVNKAGREFVHSLNISTLKAGTYLIQISLGDGYAVKRLIKE
jgi:PKD repeat protein